MTDRINTGSNDWRTVLKFLDEEESHLIDELKQTNISHEDSQVLRGRLAIISDLRDLPKTLALRDEG